MFSWPNCYSLGTKSQHLMGGIFFGNQIIRLVSPFANYTPPKARKLTWNLKMMVFNIGISSSRGSFSGSMLVFGGVSSKHQRWDLSAFHLFKKATWTLENFSPKGFPCEFTWILVVLLSSSMVSSLSYSSMRKAGAHGWRLPRTFEGQRMTLKRLPGDSSRDLFGMVK